MSGEFLQLEDIDLDTINQSWALELHQECLHMCSKIFLNGMRVIQEIDSREEINKKYIKQFAQCLQTKMNDATSHLDTMYQYYLDKIGSLLNKATILENKLEITSASSVTEMDFTTISLAQYEAALKIKVNEYQKMLDEQNKLLEELQKKHSFYISKLGQSPKRLSLPQGKTAIEEFKNEIKKLEKKITNRQERYNKIKRKIEKIVEVNEVMSKEKLAEFCSDSVKVSKEMMTKIEDLYKEALRLRTDLYEEIDTLNRELENLWDLLEVPGEEQLQFLNTLNGPSQTSQQKLKSEIKRLMKIGKTKLPVIIEKQKIRIHNLWDCCHVNPSTRHSFPFIYNNDYTEELYWKCHEEIIKWQKYYEKHREILQQLEEYKKLQNNLLEINLNTEETYKNQQGILPSLIKKKKVIASRLVVTERKLLAMSNDYFKKNKKSFNTCGMTIEIFLDKEKRKQGLTWNIQEDRSKLSPKQHPITTQKKIPARHFSRHHILKNSSFIDLRHAKTQSKAKIPTLPKFKLNQTKTNTPPSKSHWKPSGLQSTERKRSDDENSWTEYSDFEKEIKTNPFRSTSFRKENK